VAICLWPRTGGNRLRHGFKNSVLMLETHRIALRGDLARRGLQDLDNPQAAQPIRKRRTALSNAGGGNFRLPLARVLRREGGGPHRSAGGWRMGGWGGSWGVPFIVIPFSKPLIFSVVSRSS